MSQADWRKIQKTNFTKASVLSAFLGIPVEKDYSFPLNLPMRLAEKMEKGNPEDPLFRQFVPLPEERVNPLGFALDPVEDSAFCKSPKLIQKYQGRALLVTTGACAMHCRYCFRKNFPYSGAKGFEEELTAIRSTPEVKEVILSGGDPLSLSDESLSNLLRDLSSISHVELIRFHTRFPIGIPERISPSFLSILANCPIPITFIVQINHVKELDPDVLASLKEVAKLGIPVLSQTVLLKKVNDSVEALSALFWLLVRNGIIPYYLHQLDQVAGTHHFEVEEEVGKKLIEELRDRLPGYAVPRYVREIPHAAAKTLL